MKSVYRLMRDKGAVIVCFLCSQCTRTACPHATPCLALASAEMGWLWVRCNMSGVLAEPDIVSSVVSEEDRQSSERR
ncbi:hypothetical protein BDW74DRAFT_162387 [Aspergillus multicolor]|uniref:uncharacterized protein n=1 Tax=Aspergillus multicolor TaxID=41759 RepID=UPI003CCE11BD